MDESEAAYDVGNMQHQADFRALEISSGNREWLQRLEERMDRHERDCMEERRQAAVQRTALANAINAMTVQQTVMHGENRQAINKVQIATLGQIVLLLLTAFAASMTKALGWW